MKWLTAIILVFVLPVACMGIYIKKSKSEFLDARDFFEIIANECRKYGECPTPEQFENIRIKHKVDLNVKYTRGEYEIPGKDNKRGVEASGNRYFRVYYYPLTEFAYFASGGADVALVMWADTDGIVTVYE